jgi:hypothetical protein
MTDVKSLLSENVGDLRAPKMSRFLNVLTILTFIGCVWSAVNAIFIFDYIEISYTAYKKITSIPIPVSGLLALEKALMEKGGKLIETQYKYRIPFILITLASVGLRAFGALKMRKLELKGLWIYLAGEIALPIFLNIVFFSGGGLSGNFTGIFGLILLLVFIILYLTRKPELVN